MTTTFGTLFILFNCPQFCYFSPDFIVFTNEFAVFLYAAWMRNKPIVSSA